MFGL
ncbi:hypothetical protein F383_00059 [Gossypium arboreum]|jgi:hypothetical protein